MKFNKILIALFIMAVISQSVLCRKHTQKRRHARLENEEKGSEEGGEEVKGPPSDLSARMERKIRSKGTYVMNVVQFEPTGEAAEKLAAVETTPEETTEKATEEASEEGPELAPRDNSDMFNGDKIELPVICSSSSMQPQELAGLLKHGAEYMAQWGTAGGLQAPFIFNDLPHLKTAEFLKFYTAITEGAKAEGTEIDISEATSKPDLLIATVAQGDKNRQDVSWLEFWVYMCGGTNENKTEWMGAEWTEEQIAAHEAKRQKVIEAEKAFNKKRQEEFEAAKAKEAAEKAAEEAAEEAKQQGATSTEEKRRKRFNKKRNHRRRHH